MASRKLVPRFFLAFLVIFFMGVASALPALLGVRLITPNGQELMSFKKNTAYIEKTPYKIERGGPDRLKLTREGTDEGVFLKRLGVKLVIRDLKGNLMHIIRKEGWVFRVDSPIGAHLVFLKVSPKEVTIFREEGKTLFTLIPKFKSVLMNDKNGKTVYILKGDNKLYPAGFLCLPELTPEERAACYLLYKKIPLDYQ